MPDTDHPTTLMHFVTPGSITPVCGASSDDEWHNIPGRVTCFACRRTEAFKAEQKWGVEPPTPPIKLSGVMARSEEIAELGREARRREAATQKNERGMYVIEETIHHGDYRSVRRVEVYAINATTVDAVIQSSAYAYGSWWAADSPHVEVRRNQLRQLVEDLKHGRTNRQIGWSTFRLITEH